MALLSVRALHNVLIPAQREWERWMATGPLPWGEPWSRARELPSSWGSRTLHPQRCLFQGVPAAPPVTPFVEWGKGTWAVPLAVSIVLAKLRLCRPLGLFSTCRLKAMTPDESREP